MFAFEAIELDLQFEKLKFAQMPADGTNRHLIPNEMEKVQQLGAKMFERLIAGDIKDRYEEARDIAQRGTSSTSNKTLHPCERTRIIAVGVSIR